MREPTLRKRSFVELDVETPVDALRAEVAALPAGTWRDTLWADVHGSVAVVLLRGGRAGTSDDFTSDEVVDHPVLARLPTIAGLIGPDGPFGGCRYAFLFRMAPHGVSREHEDGHPVWHRHHRIHVPITTAPDAVLVADGRACHLAPGRAWTFDNQSRHGFANGASERVHLIFDVPEGPVVRRLLDAGRHVPGVPDPDASRRIARPAQDDAIVIAPGEARDRWSLRDLFRRSALHGPDDRAWLLAHPEHLVWDAAPLAAGRVRVARVGGAIAGFATWEPGEAGALEVVDLFVEPKRMRHGVGRALIADLVTCARAAGAGALEVTGNPHALAFYRAVGFVQVGERPTERITAPRLRRSLS